MKHLINDRATLVEEMLEGLVCAYQGTVIKVPDVNGIVKCHIEEGKVALLVGGGSGHEPIYHGLVGKNMADAAAVGNIFASRIPGLSMRLPKPVREAMVFYSCTATMQVMS